MDIIAVKENGQGGFLVNGEMNVPNAEGNRHYVMVQEWIANGGVIEPFETAAEAAARLIAEENEAAKADLKKIDLGSIRDIREWVASQLTAPQTIKDREAQAIAARGRIK